MEEGDDADHDINSTNQSASDNTKSTSDRSKTKWPRQTKFYNPKWERDPLLKTWISRHPSDSSKVVCKYCQSTIRAHKNDLLEHTKTVKHRKSYQKSTTPEEYNKFSLDLKDLIKEATYIKPRANQPVGSSPMTNGQCVTLTIGSPIEGELSSNSTFILTDKNSSDFSEVFGETDELWQESEDFTSTESPSDLVSVILEEQQSPTCSVSVTSVDSSTLLTTNNANEGIQVIPSVNSLITLSSFISCSPGIVTTTTVLTQTQCLNSCDVHVTSATFASPTSHHTDNGVIKEVVLMKNDLTYSEVMEAISSGQFSVTQLCSISKAAVDKIAQLNSQQTILSSSVITPILETGTETILPAVSSTLSNDSLCNIKFLPFDTKQILVDSCNKKGMK